MSMIAVKIEIGKNVLQDNVDPSMSLRDVKRNWSDKYNVDIKSVRFNNQILSDENNCNFYNIRTGSTVQLNSDESDDQINLLVELQSVNPNQRSCQIRVNPNITTEELMSVIRNKVPFDVGSAYLTHHNEELPSGISLKDQSVKNNDTIKVLMKTRGG